MASKTMWEISINIDYNMQMRLWSKSHFFQNSFFMANLFGIIFGNVEIAPEMSFEGIQSDFSENF